MASDLSHNPAPDPADDPAFLARVARYLDPDLTDAEAAEVTAALRLDLATDPAKRRAFVLICTADAALHEEFAASAARDDHVNDLGYDDDHARDAASLHDRIVLPALHDAASPTDGAATLAPAPPTARVTHPSRRRWVAGAAAAAVLLVATLVTVFAQRGSSRGATVTSAASARWDDGAARPPGSTLPARQPLSLVGGVVACRTADGSDVVIEAPARFTIDGAAGLTLSAGRAAVRMPTGHAGFVVATPHARVTDLGTSFGVWVDPAAATTAVHVFDGRVSLAPAATRANPRVVAAGDAARVAAGKVTVAPGQAAAQLFVRGGGTDGTGPLAPLGIADLISGGDGTGHARDGVVDHATGAAGRRGSMTLHGDYRSDGRYHPVPSLPVVDGCFMPAPGGAPSQVDSAGHTFRFANASGLTSVRICAGGPIPPLENGDVILTRIGDTDYAAPGHDFLFLHPDAGLTLDLDAIRRLHPVARLTRLHCTVGFTNPHKPTRRADAFVLVDGAPRFTRLNLSLADGPVDIDVPLSPTDRFLTLCTTGGGDGVGGDQVLLGDPTLHLAPR